MPDISLYMAFAAGLISFLSPFWRFFGGIKKYLRLLDVAAGIILVILGGLIFSNKLILIPGYLSFLNKFSL